MPISSDRVEPYLRAWDAVGELLDNGKSWSGHERNVAFLNVGGGDFVDVSYLTGLDYDSDSRAVAVTDWDGDGDLDLWYRNRTGPRLRYLQNGCKTENGFVSLRLRGVDANADAIGARVEVRLRGGKRHSRTLRAGEGYLAQSTKMMHFGLGRGREIEAVTVQWPAGAKEEYSGILANRRYVLTQGKGVALEIPNRKVTDLRTSRLPELPGSSRIRIVPHAPLPLPVVPYVTTDGIKTLSVNGKGMLVTLWTSICPACLRDLTLLARVESELLQKRVELLCINADNIDDPVEARMDAAIKRASSMGYTGPMSLATNDTLELLDVMQRVLVSTHNPLPVPTSFLLRSDGRLAAVYHGELHAEELLADVEALPGFSGDFRNVAVPFDGRWYVNPFPADVFAVPQKLLELNRGDDVMRYLDRHRLGADWDSGKAVDLYCQAGRQLAANGNTRSAYRAFESALHWKKEHVPALTALSFLARSEGDSKEAVRYLRRVLTVERQNLAALESLAWILATATDPEVRAPGEALQLATVVREATGDAAPDPLDTLAAALAAAGRHKEAVQNAEKALALVEASGKGEAVEKKSAGIKKRIELYKQGKSIGRE